MGDGWDRGAAGSAGDEQDGCGWGRVLRLLHLGQAAGPGAEDLRRVGASWYPMVAGATGLRVRRRVRLARFDELGFQVHAGDEERDVAAEQFEAGLQRSP